MSTKNTAFFSAFILSSVLHADIFTEIDNHFRQLWGNFEHINELSTNGTLSVTSSYDKEKNIVIVKIGIPGLTEKDVAFDVHENKMVLDAKTDTHESRIVITNHSIVVEQTEYEELTNKSGKKYTFVTAHNRVVNSLPHGVILKEAQAEYENNILTITFPSNSKRIAIPITHKNTISVTANAAADMVTEEKPVIETEKKTKKIIINSTKKQKAVENDIK